MSMQKKGIDKATVVLVLIYLLVPVFLVFAFGHYAPYDEDEAMDALVHSHGALSCCTVTGIDAAWTGGAIRIPSFCPACKGDIVAVDADFLKNSSIKYLFFGCRASAIDPAMFAGHEYVAVYTNLDAVAKVVAEAGISVAGDYNAYMSDLRSLQSVPPLQAVSELAVPLIMQIPQSMTACAVIIGVTFVVFRSLRKWRMKQGFMDPMFGLDRDWILGRFNVLLNVFAGMIGFVGVYTNMANVSPQLMADAWAFTQRWPLWILLGLLAFSLLIDCINKAVLWLPAKIWYRAVEALASAAVGCLLAYAVASIGNEFFIVHLLVALLGVVLFFGSIVSFAASLGMPSIGAMMISGGSQNAEQPDAAPEYTPASPTVSFPNALWSPDGDLYRKTSGGFSHATYHCSKTGHQVTFYESDVEDGLPGGWRSAG